MREQIEYHLVKLFLWLASRIPKVFIYALMKWLAILIYYLDKNRRTLTVQNLSIAFPEKTPKEIKILAKEVYRQLSITIAEILLMFVGEFNIDKAIKNKKEIQERLEKIRQNAPYGIIVMTAHFSNWELAAHFLAKNGLPMLAIGRKGNNRLIENNLTKPFREKYGNHAVSKGKAMLAMIRKLKNAGNVGILIDQKSGRENGVKVDFFGEPAETTVSIATLKLKFDPLVLPIFLVRDHDGEYKMLIGESIDYRADEIKEEQEKLKAMTLYYNQAIESMVRQYPSQWLWMHNRWRR